jgi:hypothetical protein
VEKSKVERFRIGRNDLHEICRALIANIPQMRVRTLEFNLGEEDLEHFIRAVKQNTSLRTVVGDSINEYGDY